MPFILQKFLKLTNLKNNEIITIKIRLNIKTILVSKYIISCWIIIARIMKVTFSNEFTSNKYNLLQRCFDAELDFLPKVII